MSRNDQLTVKQENFCIYYVELNNASEAYRRAYDVKTMSNISIGREASRTKLSPRVAARIAELRKNLTDSLEISVERILSELAEIGFDKKDAKNADRISALEKLGKHLGMFVEKLDVKIKDELSADEYARRTAFALQRAARGRAEKSEARLPESDGE